MDVVLLRLMIFGRRVNARRIKRAKKTSSR
jgi:hypothetical protein